MKANDWPNDNEYNDRLVYMANQLMKGYGRSSRSMRRQQQQQQQPSSVGGKVSLAEVWAFVEGGLSAAGTLDRDDVIKAADAVQDTLLRGMRFDEKEHAKEQAAARARSRRKKVELGQKTIVSLVVVAIVLFAVFKIVHYIATEGKHNYAGYGPSKVSGHGFQALSDYLLTESKARMVSQSRSHINGDTPAWKTVFVAGGKRYCVFVWGGSETYSRVTTC